MKKTILATAVLSTLFASCGSDDKKDGSEDKEKMCKTYKGVEAPCKVIEDLDKLDEMSFDLVDYSPSENIGYAEAIAKNEEVFKQMEPLQASLEAMIKISPEYAEENYIERIEEYRAETEDYKKIIEDLKTLEFSASYEQDPVFEDKKDEMIRFKNTTDNTISYMAGSMRYLDSAGNVLAEDDIAYYDFHFEPERKTGLEPGYEGYTDNGINCDKEKRELIHTIELTIDEIRYFKPEEE